MKSLLLLLLFSCSVQAWDKSDLDPLYVEVDEERNAGTMVVNWHGGKPLTHYEGRWLDYEVSDTDTGYALSMEFWVQTWYGVCMSPCEMLMTFVTRNVKLITK